MFDFKVKDFNHPKFKGTFITNRSTSSPDSKSLISQLSLDPNKPSTDRSINVVNLDEVEKLYRTWHTELPNVHPYYAVKCNPDPGIISTLVNLGSGFDCASLNEMILALELGVSPDKIIYAHPCKFVSHLQFAKENGVKKMTVDNSDELDKIKANHEDASLIIRIKTDDSDSDNPFSAKFGASLAIASKLLLKSQLLKLSVVGVSFHVGGNCGNPDSFSLAIADCKKLFDIAYKEYGIQLSLLDIGGGYPDADGKQSKTNFKEVTEVIRNSLNKHFTDNKHNDTKLEIIAEPGRYFSSSTTSLAVQITSRNLSHFNHPDSLNMYYINDGIHGSFNCLLFDYYTPEYTILRQNEKLQSEQANGEQTYPSCVWGPACNSIDLIIKKADLPLLECGDWLIFENMGAYRGAIATNFNGFDFPFNYYHHTGKQ